MCRMINTILNLHSEFNSTGYKTNYSARIQTAVVVGGPKTSARTPSTSPLLRRRRRSSQLFGASDHTIEFTAADNGISSVLAGDATSSMVVVRLWNPELTQSRMFGTAGDVHVIDFLIEDVFSFLDSFQLKLS